jgi:hypothetical protein
VAVLKPIGIVVVKALAATAPGALCRQFREPIELIVRPAVLDRRVLALNPTSASQNPRRNPHSARGTAATNLRRFRVLALFGRRPPHPGGRKPAQELTIGTPRQAVSFTCCACTTR